MSASLLLSLWLPGHICVAITPSLEHRVFFLTGVGQADFREGEYLLFKKRLDKAGTDRLLKKVGCSGGQRLSVENGEYRCEGKYLGRALAKNSRGELLLPFIFNGPVPTGSLFMIGSHPRSHDSRYFGFIHADTVLNKAYPLW